MRFLRNRIHRLPILLWIGLGASLLFLCSRLLQLTILPVFADEAIYIRWAQLLSHDSRYLFFALNDGKPPLFVWSLVPALSLFTDPLLAARVVSVVVGFLQMWVLWALLRISSPRSSRLPALIAGTVIVLLTPFWFFHQRMALMDGLLTLGLSISLLGFFLLDRLSWLSHWNARTILAFVPAIVLTGVGWGVALWTKTPALFFAPVFVFWALVPNEPIPRHDLLRFWLRRGLLFGLSGLLGLGLFALLKVSPAFGSLFGRSSDFTYSVSDILAGEWRSTLQNFPKVLNWLSTYMRPELLSFCLLAVLFSRQKLLHGKLLLGALLWALPLLLLGRVLHPRYFLPVAPFLTVSAALFFPEVWELLKKKRENIFASTAFFLLLLFYGISCLRFQFFAFFSPSMIPFVLDDREQYLAEWSSGHGIPQVRDALLQRAGQGLRTTVVTEGSFGTLPDGLLMYFDRRPEIQHLRIEGLAQYPVSSIPDWVHEEANNNETWLVVNEHRMALDPETNNLELIARYPRPYGAPDLQVYRVIPSQKE